MASEYFSMLRCTCSCIVRTFSPITWPPQTAEQVWLRWVKLTHVWFFISGVIFPCCSVLVTVFWEINQLQTPWSPHHVVQHSLVKRLEFQFTSRGKNKVIVHWLRNKNKSLQQVEETTVKNLWVWITEQWRSAKDSCVWFVVFLSSHYQGFCII